MQAIIFRSSRIFQMILCLRFKIFLLFIKSLWNYLIRNIAYSSPRNKRHCIIEAFESLVTEKQV